MIKSFQPLLNIHLPISLAEPDVLLNVLEDLSTERWRHFSRLSFALPVDIIFAFESEAF